MADGSTKAISTLRPGDKVKSTDTATGKTKDSTTSAVLVNRDTDLYDLTVHTVTGEQVIHATAHHLFYDKTTHSWVQAAKLHRGDQLTTDDGSIVTVVAGDTPAKTTGDMWDLTVPGDHDFYVVAGDTPVLVHNAGGPDCGINWSPNSRPTFGHTFSRHGAGAKNAQSLIDRARSTGDAQGQWLDNNAAAQFLQENYVPNAGVYATRIPSGLGQVIMPDGTIVSADWAMIVPSANGLYKTAYPILGGP
jgi:hypothetical protein